MFKLSLCISLFTAALSLQLKAQESPMSPMNNEANLELLKSEVSEMNWYMLQDTIKVKIGTIQTQIQKGKENIYIISTVNMQQSPSKWIDSTVVETQTLKPVYHSSYNPQRDMVLNFGEMITGYYLNKQEQLKKEISETVDGSFFDSNFYPQLIRFLPLKGKYTRTISIFDYNPTAKIGVISATIRHTEKMVIDFKGKMRKVWKVEITDDISDNTAISTYYIDVSTRKILKQEIDFGGRKMLMESDK